MPVGSGLGVLGWGPGPVSLTSGGAFALNPQPRTANGFSAACQVSGLFHECQWNTLSHERTSPF